MSPRPFNRYIAKHNPERTFGSPLDIVAERLLTKGEKIATLNRWRHTVLEQLNASGEGIRAHAMSAERALVLEQIQEATSRLSGTSA
jgi:hypothetical protein